MLARREITDDYDDDGEGGRYAGRKPCGVKTARRRGKGMHFSTGEKSSSSTDKKYIRR